MPAWIKFGRRRGDGKKVVTFASLIIIFTVFIAVFVQDGISSIRERHQLETRIAQLQSTTDGLQPNEDLDKSAIGRLTCYSGGAVSWYADVLENHGVDNRGMWVIETTHDHLMTFSPSGCVFQQTTAKADDADPDVHSSHG